MFKKEKILVSLVILMLVACVLGSVKSLATEITAINNTNTVITPITAANNTNIISITGTVGNNTVNKISINAVNNTVKNTVKNTANSSSYEKTNSTKLPYAGTTNSTIIFIVLGFAASAIYAYKKVSEYNV